MQLNSVSVGLATSPLKPDLRELPVMSCYTEWLREQGAPVFEGAGVSWQLSQGGLTPASAGPSMVERITTSEGRALLRESGALFLRYSSDPSEHETAWWHIVCDAYDVSRLSSSTRSKVNRGNRRCEVKRLEPEWLAEHGYECYVAAHTRYKNVEPSSRERFRSNILKTIGGPFEYWGVLIGGGLSGYCQCILEGKNAATNVIKFDPSDLKHYTSYTLMNAIMNHYVNGQSKTLSNGTRPIAHDTNIQDFLIKFGFRRQYCRLNVIYQPWLALGARVGFPFRKLVSRLPDQGLVHRMRVFLFQEEIRRLCR